MSSVRQAGLFVLRMSRLSAKNCGERRLPSIDGLKPTGRNRPLFAGRREEERQEMCIGPATLFPGGKRCDIQSRLPHDRQAP